MKKLKDAVKADLPVKAFTKDLSREGGRRSLRTLEVLEARLEKRLKKRQSDWKKRDKNITTTPDGIKKALRKWVENGSHVDLERLRQPENLKQIRAAISAMKRRLDQNR